METKGRLVSGQLRVRRTLRGQKRARGAGVVAVLASVIAVLVIAAGCGAAKDPDRHLLGDGQLAGVRPAASGTRRLPVVTLTIPPAAHPEPIPRSFLGLSSEYWTVAIEERHVKLYTRVLSLLHVPGDGRLVLRIGGDSSDSARYDPHRLRTPRWEFAITPRFVAGTAMIVRALHLRVILDLNLFTGSPELAAAWVADAESAFGAPSIIGYEMGNEPDLYRRALWLRITDPDGSAPLVPHAITPASYAADYEAYAHAIDRIDPKVALLGPAVSDARTRLRWISTLLAAPHPGLRQITAHRYPYSGCAFSGSARYPTIARVLSENASAGMAQSVKPMVLLARNAGLSARLTEFNSVTCGGLRGVSNSFATALWAPDAIFELMRTGLSGVNLHARLKTINSPFMFDARGLVARPLLYGLILFTRTLGAGARLMPVELHSAPSLNLKAWAVRVAGDHLHVLLLDKGPKSAAVRLKLPASGPATVQRLLAPSVRSRLGVTLAGQTLDRYARWTGPRHVERVMPRADQYSVTLPHYSAALLSVQTTDRLEVWRRSRSSLDEHRRRVRVS